MKQILIFSLLIVLVLLQNTPTNPTTEQRPTTRPANRSANPVGPAFTSPFANEDPN